MHALDNSMAGESILPSAPKEIHPDLARHLLDTAPLKLAFYSVFAGWREQLVPKTYTTALGDKKTKTEMVIKVSKDRLCNEAGADYLYQSIYPLVSPNEATSKIKPIDLYNAWHTRLHELTWTLAKKCIRKNPFEMDVSSIPEIISNIAQLYVISQRAEEGWTMTKIADQYTSSLIVHHTPQGEQPVVINPPKQGIIQSLLNKK